MVARKISSSASGFSSIAGLRWCGLLCGSLRGNRLYMKTVHRWRRRPFAGSFGLITILHKVLGRSTIVTLHDIAVAVFWVFLSAKALAGTSMAMASSFAFEVCEHIGLGDENMSTM